MRRNKELMRTLRVTEAKQAFDESVRASAKTNPNRSKKTKTKRESEMLLRQNRLEGARGFEVSLLARKWRLARTINPWE